MIARITSAQVAPERIDEFAQWWQDTIGGFKGRTPGFHSAYLLGDRQTGRGQGIALWESRETMEAALPQIDSGGEFVGRLISEQSEAVQARKIGRKASSK